MVLRKTVQRVDAIASVAEEAKAIMKQNISK